MKNLLSLFSSISLLFVLLSCDQSRLPQEEEASPEHTYREQHDPTVGEPAIRPDGMDAPTPPGSQR